MFDVVTKRCRSGTAQSRHVSMKKLSDWMIDAATKVIADVFDCSRFGVAAINCCVRRELEGHRGRLERTPDTTHKASNMIGRLEKCTDHMVKARKIRAWCRQPAKQENR